VIAVAANIFGAFVASLASEEKNADEQERLPVADTQARKHISQFSAFFSSRKGYLTALFCLTMTITGSVLLKETGDRYSIIFFAAAFGAQNVFSERSHKLRISTTVATGNYQKLGSLAASLLRGELHLNSRQELDKLLPLASAASTLVGAVVGGLVLYLGKLFDYAEFIVAGLQLVLFILHDELL